MKKSTKQKMKKTKIKLEKKSGVPNLDEKGGGIPIEGEINSAVFGPKRGYCGSRIGFGPKSRGFFQTANPYIYAFFHGRFCFKPRWLLGRPLKKHEKSADRPPPHLPGSFQLRRAS